VRAHSACGRDDISRHRLPSEFAERSEHTAQWLRGRARIRTHTRAGVVEQVMPVAATPLGKFTALNVYVLAS
jgi:hypothetical protein